jgi:Trk-type K+ transport system membrane component
MALVLHFKYAYPIKPSLTFSFFHCVSAFNNAGFSIYSNNLESYVSDFSINIIIMLLIILGGIGFPVISEILSYRKTRHFHFMQNSIHYDYINFGGALLFFLLNLKIRQQLVKTPLLQNNFKLFPGW